MNFDPILPANIQAPTTKPSQPTSAPETRFEDVLPEFLAGELLAASQRPGTLSQAGLQATFEPNEDGQMKPVITSPNGSSSEVSYAELDMLCNGLGVQASLLGS